MLTVNKQFRFKSVFIDLFKIIIDYYVIKMDNDNPLILKEMINCLNHNIILINQVKRGIIIIIIITLVYVFLSITTLFAYVNYILYYIQMRVI